MIYNQNSNVEVGGMLTGVFYGPKSLIGGHLGPVCMVEGGGYGWIELR